MEHEDIAPADDARSATRLIGAAASFSAMLQHVSSVAPLNKPVLVVGERGTGKELVASRIHYLSSRWDKHFETLNCAAINDSLLESELFGHEAGAFTGASKRHLGRFERSHGGSLFMDELATTSQRVQQQLLRVIEYGEFQRLGGSEVLRSDVRLIAATNEDLPGLAKAGKFRFDLLDRLSFDVITLPPLRERQDDILLLAEHFANGMSRELGLDYFAGFTEHAEQQLHDYAWPGNVRELKNVIERSVYRNEHNDDALNQIVFDPFASKYRPISTVANETKQTIAAANTTPQNREADELPEDLRAHLDSVEKQCIANALTQSRFNQKRAAESLGLTYHHIRASLRKFPELLEDNN
ncbi:MAG: phage shock protein operon transcriptional activator [Pseudomonadales bacterium]